MICRPCFAAIVTAAALSACTPAPPQAETISAHAVMAPDAQLAPSEFLAALYDNYHRDPAFSPMGEAAPRYFDSELVALIREDDALRGEEIGALDHDPVCQCQDSEGLRTEMTVESATGERARIRVVLSNTPGGAQRTVTFDLVTDNGLYRIHDLSSADMPSLRAHMARSNAELTTYAASQAAK